MAVEMFLDIAGVTGESQTKGFEGKIDIFSYSLGASNPTQVSTGSGSGAGKVSLSSVSIQKVVDKSTPDLFRACCSGKHFDTGKLTVREAGGAAPVTYLELDLTQVFVDSISWGAASGGDKPSESLSLSFAAITFKYQAQTAAGSADQGPTAGWDIQKNAATA
jgi:type VI secretion system secreted protein Hcp